MDELDGLRIRRISDLRRATARSRSHFIIIAVAAAVGVMQLAITLGSHWRDRSGGWVDLVYAALALGLMVVVDVCVRKALRLNRELKRSLLYEPHRPPDFSTLSDGSQFASNLEEVNDDREE